MITRSSSPKSGRRRATPTPGAQRGWALFSGIQRPSRIAASSSRAAEAASRGMGSSSGAAGGG
jgi:hypothetical protein